MRKFILILALAAFCSPLLLSQAQAAQGKAHHQKRHHHQHFKHHAGHHHKAA
jgi:Ni/Co efflux regulator RcnB